jgi:GNAT superfamily N-acetyltransferase
MELLAERWASGQDRFDRDGEVLLAGYIAGRLAGIGGLSIETAMTEPARRLRRFYILPEHRRQGVATALASALIQEALNQVRVLTVNAKASAAAGPFWEAQGFKADDAGPWTHIYRPE